MVDAQSALIATPVRKLDLIGAKVNALYHRFGGDQGGDLSNPTTQTVIMGLNPRPLTEDDASQCLLSVYLDLAAAAQDRTAWDAAVLSVVVAALSVGPPTMVAAPSTHLRPLERLFSCAPPQEMTITFQLIGMRVKSWASTVAVTELDSFD